MNIFGSSEKLKDYVKYIIFYKNYKFLKNLTIQN